MTNDINIFRKDNYDITVNFIDSDGNAIDISSYVIFFTVKDNVDDADSDALIKTDQTIVDGTAGTATISLIPGDTSSLKPGKYFYDIQWKDTNDKIKTLVKGDFVLNADITARTTPE